MLIRVVLLFLLLVSVHLGFYLTPEITPPIMFCGPGKAALLAGGLLALLFGAFSLTEIGGAAGFVFSPVREISGDRRARLSRVYAAVGDFSLYLGVLTTYFGLVLMLQNMDDPSQVGPNLVTAVIPMFYGLTGKLVSVLMQRKLALCGTSREQAPGKPRRAGLAFAVSSILFLALLVVVISATVNLPSYFDLTSFLIVAVGGLFLSLLACTPASIREAFATAIAGGEANPAGEQKALEAFTQLHDSVMTMTVLGSLAALAVLPITEPSALGPVITVMLLTVFYGVIIACLIRVLHYAVLRRSLFSEAEPGRKPLISFGLGASFSMLIVLLAALSLLLP